MKEQSDGIAPRCGFFLDAVLNEIDEKWIGELLQVSLEVGWLTQLVLLSSLQQLGTSHDEGADAEGVNVRGRRQRLGLAILGSYVMKILLLSPTGESVKRRNGSGEY